MMASLPTPPPEGLPVPMYESIPLPEDMATGPVLEETTPPPEEASTSLSSHPSLAPLDHHQLLSAPSSSSSLGPMSSSTGPLGPIHPGASAWDPLAAPEWDSTPPSFHCLNRCSLFCLYLVKNFHLISGSSGTWPQSTGSLPLECLLCLTRKI